MGCVISINLFKKQSAVKRIVGVVKYKQALPLMLYHLGFTAQVLPHIRLHNPKSTGSRTQSGLNSSRLKVNEID